MGFFFLGYDATYYAAVGELYVLGNPIPVDEETCVFSLHISDSL